MSLSMPFVSQLGQSQLRIFNGSLSITKPQWLHRLELGKNRSILTNLRPYQSHLYSSWRNISDHAASEIDRASLLVFDHVSNGKIFNSNYAIGSDQISSQLVQEISTSIFNFGVYLSYFKSRFISVIRAFGFPTQLLLREWQLLIQPIKVLWVSYFFSVTGSQQTRDANVNSDFFIGWWQWLNSRIIYQQRNKPSARRFKLDCNSRWIHTPKARI